MGRKYTARVDANQAAITRDLRDCGYHVTLLHTVGRGVPDMLVTGYRHATDTVAALLVEVKTDGGKLTDDERAWHAEYPDGGPLIVARKAEDVITWFEGGNE